MKVLLEVDMMVRTQKQLTIKQPKLADKTIIRFDNLTFHRHTTLSGENVLNI